MKTGKQATDEHEFAAARGAVGEELTAPVRSAIKRVTDRDITEAAERVRDARAAVNAAQKRLESEFDRYNQLMRLAKRQVTAKRRARRRA